MSNQLKRRTFIGATVTGAVGLATAIHGSSQASETASGCTGNCQPGMCAHCKAMNQNFSIGMILYTIRDYLKTPDDIARSLEKVKQIGYTNIELASVGAISNSELAKIVQKNELKVVSAHGSWDQMRNEPNKTIDQYKELGCDHVVVSSLPNPYRSKEGYVEFAKTASEVAAKLAEGGIQFAYHNHSFEFVKYDGVCGQQLLIDHSDPNLFLFEIDTYWVQHGGGDPAQWIRKVAGRVSRVHMKDMMMVIKEGEFHPTPMFAEVGEGNLNWGQILKACYDAKAKHCIVEQDQSLRDPMDSIAISLKHMQTWGLTA